MKEVEVIFKKEAYYEYNKLKRFVKNKNKTKKFPSYNQLLKSVDKTLDNIKSNPFYGCLIPRKYLSKKIINDYATDQIYRVELVGYWRLLYTLKGDKIKIIAFILEFVSHDKYNKLFEYKKK